MFYTVSNVSNVGYPIQNFKTLPFQSCQVSSGGCVQDSQDRLTLIFVSEDSWIQFTRACLHYVVEAMKVEKFDQFLFKGIQS